MTTILERPEELSGKTYKFKTPQSEDAYYVTINNKMKDGRLIPFEMFVNSKNVEHFAWVVALTRVISAVFRHGSDAAFLADELAAVFDPKGGYFQVGGGGRYMPSMIAEMGAILEKHLVSIGYTPANEPVALPPSKQIAHSEAPQGSQCSECYQFAVVIMDGCETCTSCGRSKCG